MHVSLPGQSRKNNLKSSACVNAFHKLCMMFTFGVFFIDDSDGKRREAVRRKTAQYLVKAEFLFNTYLKHDENDMKDWSVKPQNSCHDITDRSIVDRQFGHLTLASLKVIGVIGKVRSVMEIISVKTLSEI